MPLLFLAIPLAAVVVLSLALKLLNEKVALWAAIIIAGWQTVLAAVDIGLCLKPGSVLSSAYIGSLSIDNLSAVVLFAIGLMAFVSLIVAKSTVKESIFNFSNMIMLIMLGMNGLVLVRDLFSMYVFVEVISAASFII